MDRTSKIKSGLYFGIAMALFFILKELLTHDGLTIKNISIIIVAGLLGGALAGLLFGWLIGLLANSKFLANSAQINIDSNETIVFETGANHFKGAEGVGGKLYLTNKRLVFKSHKYNIQNHELSISLPDIDKVDRYKTLGIANNGLAVITKTNATEKFAVQQPDQWLNKLREVCGSPQVHLS